jgi:hypothetical protein
LPLGARKAAPFGRRFRLCSTEPAAFFDAAAARFCVAFMSNFNGLVQSNENAAAVVLQPSPEKLWGHPALERFQEKCATVGTLSLPTSHRNRDKAKNESIFGVQKTKMFWRTGS